jgi:Fe-S cluster assembly ATPase SufC
VLVNGKIVKTGCSDLAKELEKDGYVGVETKR